MDRWGFHFNGQRCTGCKTCVLACKDYHDLPISLAYRQVYEYSGGSWSQDISGAWTTDSYAYYVSLGCNHCLNPACVRACPTGAMHKSDVGFVSVDEEKCVGCGYCALTCPYHAPKLDLDAGHSVKCNGCEERVVRGGAPVCVESCPQRALEFGAFADLLADNGAGTDIAPLPTSNWTGPSLVVTPPHNARPADDDTGSITNTDEIV